MCSTLVRRFLHDEEHKKYASIRRGVDCSVDMYYSTYAHSQMCSARVTKMYHIVWIQAQKIYFSILRSTAIYWGYFNFYVLFFRRIIIVFCPNSTAISHVTVSGVLCFKMSENHIEPFKNVEIP